MAGSSSSSGAAGGAGAGAGGAAARARVVEWQPSTTLGLEQAALALGGEEPGFRLLRLDVMRWLLDIETMNIETPGAASAAPGTLCDVTQPSLVTEHSPCQTEE